MLATVDGKLAGKKGGADSKVRLIKFLFLPDNLGGDVERFFILFVLLMGGQSHQQPGPP
jgi:hypothetical protein